MSNYGPPGGPRPPQEPYGRQPNDPYGQPNDPYGQPSDPWGGQPSSAPGGEPLYGPGYGQPSDPRYGGQRPYDQGYGNDTGYRDPGYGQQYPPQQGYGATQSYPPQPGGYDPYQQGWAPATSEPPPRRKGRFSPVLVLVLTLALLVCGGTGVALYLVGRPDDDKGGNTAGGTPTTSPTAAPTPSQAPSATASPGAGSAADARFVKKGQCVKNVGTNAKPQLQITKCVDKTYEVLARFDTATTGEADAQAKCKDVEGYTDWYYFDSPLDLNDYVLCLKLR